MLLWFEYINNQEKFKVRCEEGHVFKTNWSIINRGHFCPECGWVRTGLANKNDAQWLHDLCKEKGIVWLEKKDKVYKGTNKKHWFLCPEQHEWQTKPNSIQSGSGCHECSAHRTERKVRGLFEYIFQDTFNKSWARGIELDGYNENLQIAFEYNGYQHYEVAHFDAYSKKGLKERKERDSQRRRVCKKLGIRLIEIPYTVKDEELCDFVFNKLKYVRGVRKPSPKRIQNIFNKYSYQREKNPKFLDIKLVNKIRKDIVKGVSDKKCSIKYDVGKFTIEGIRTGRLFTDIDWTPIKRHTNNRALPIEKKKRLIADVQSGKDVSYIANKYNIAKQTVYGFRSELGVTNKDENERIKEAFRNGITMMKAQEKFDRPKTTLYRLKRMSVL